jgi:hypothetical protein
MIGSRGGRSSPASSRTGRPGGRAFGGTARPATCAFGAILGAANDIDSMPLPLVAAYCGNENGGLMSSLWKMRFTGAASTAV